MKPKSRARQTVAVIGTGLIGASIGLALRKASARAYIVGWDSRRLHARTAKRRGALSEVAPSLNEAVNGASVIVLAVPLAAVIALLPQVMSKARTGSLVIDVAGLKEPVIAAASRALKQKPGVAFVGGHPLAGLERGGAKHAAAGLFQSRPFALCVPPQRERSTALRRAMAFVRRLGARPVCLSAKFHDRIVAATSGLPQLAASAAALAICDSIAGRTKLVGPGYEDVTRLAQSPAGLWTHSLLANRGNVGRAMAVFEMRVRELRSAIEHGDAAGLARLLRCAVAARRRLKPR